MASIDFSKAGFDPESGYILKITDMNALEHFQQIFPSHRLFSDDGELRYRFASEQIGRIYERIAQKVIINNGLRATAELEVSESGGQVKEVAMVVKEAPEESLVARG